MTLTEQQEKNALGAIGATDFTPFQAPKEPEKKPDDISADRAVSEGERQYNAILSGQNPFPTAEETLAAVESMPGVQEGMEASRKALHTETLTLEYPALAENINDALAKGWNRDKLRKYLAGREMYVRMYYTQDDLDKLLGRTDETKRDFWEAMKRQQDDGYVRIMHRDMSEDRVRDILRTAELTGLQPGTLLQAPKEFLDEAEKMAGERMGALKELLYRGFNAYANWRKGKSEKATGQARDLRELLKDDAALIAEGRAQLIQDGNHYLPQEFSAQPRSDEEMKELWRKSIEKQIADMEKSAKENEDISKNWYTNIRPSDNAIWATICGAIENSGFSIESGFLSGLAWKLGGPFGGLLMSIYNTISEADTEAGGAFVEAKNRGWNDEDAYKAFLDVRRNNLILLPFSNYGGDFLLHGAGKLFETLAATIPGTGWGQRFMRGLITRGLPLIGEAVPEGVEELAQEYFQMDALKEPINEGKLWEAFRSGMGQAVLYSLAGVGTRRAASWIMGKTPTGKAMSRIEQEAREAAELGTKIAKGEIEPDTIVGEDPVVFVPRDALSETAVRELGLEPEVMEKPLDEGEDTGEAPAAAPETAAPAAGEEAEDTTPDEIAVRKSVWDEWAAKHPEEAEALKDQVREGTKGVTAREMLERKAESVRVKAGEDPMFHSAEADEVRDTLTRQFADAGHSGELAKAEADVALRFAVVMKRTNPGVNKSLSEFTNIVVKSVTESMRETGAESYEQIIGTQGAARLDAADAGNRIDNLGIARQMEEGGKDAKTIWLATGWEKGKDGKWRHEILDGDLTLANVFNTPEKARYQRLLLKNQAGTLTEAERRELSEQGKKWTQYNREGQKFTLPDVYDNEELYEAYPELRDVEVRLYSSYVHFGAYSKTGNNITIGLDKVYHPEAPEGFSLKDVMVHEIQHAIQKIEGFDNGSSSYGGNYRSAAGEVEARNASARMEMSPEERLQKLLSETEDVAREDQIVLRDALGAAETESYNQATAAEGESYAQIIGERGASKLDAADAGNRIDNLGVARQMEEAGKDAKAIWLATGWQRGKEGKWNYDLMDGKINTDLKLSERLVVIYGTALDETVRETTLGELYDAPELYAAYPELKNTRVIFQRLDGATNGVAYARDNAIVVSDVYSRQTSKPNDARIKEIEATPEFKAYNEAWLAAEEAGDEETLNRIDEEWEKSELGAEYNNLLNTNRVQVSAVGRPNANMKSTLIHEIQHLVQDIEGFAKGGNPSMFNRSTDQTTMEKWAGLIENLVGAKDENGEVYTIESAAREYLRLAQEELDGLPLEEKIRHKGDFEVEDLAALSKIVNSGNIEETVKRLHEESTKPHLSAEETYRRLAGETEARNASARMEMSPEERRQKLLSETEDVAREDQIVLRDALGGESYDRAQAAELKTESGKSIEEAANSELLTAPDGSTALGYIDADTAAAIGSFEGEIQANVGALRHTEKQGHGKEIRNAGYNVQSFMIDVLNNWTEIREGNDNSLWLVRPLEDRHGGVAAIKLDNKKDGVYRVNTLMYIRERGVKNRKLLYARHPANAISHGPDVNLTRATPAKSVEYAAKGEYLSEEQSSINSLPQTGDTVKNATTSWAPGAAWQTPSLIEFFKTANASTGFHELGHHMLRVMMDISKLDGASAQLKDDINTILTHAGVTMEEFEADRDKRTQAHEYFARSWETYLSEGKAPTPELQGVFDRIRQWMIDVYHDVVQALGIDLSDDMRDVFDRLLATPEEIDAAYEARKTVGELTAETDLAAERIKALEGEVTNLTEEKAEAETPEPPADPAEEAREPVKNANTAMVRTAAGTEVEVRYRVAEADSLIASNTETGGINPDYPQELQPRQRTRESSIMQINRIASQLDPELLGENRMASDGAPIVGPDAVVESGNGRVLAIRQAYKTGGAEKYRAWLKENAERFGLDAAELDGMKAPVLVRERTGEVDRAQFAREANEASVSRMSRTEQAKADAARITPEMLAEFDPDKPVQGNRAFVQMFADGIVGRNELGSFLQANGRLSQEGLQRLTNALFAKAYGDTETLNRLSESLDDDIRNITNAMFQSSPQMGAFEIAVENGEAKPELSIREDITAAANMLSQLRQNGMSVPDFLAQIAMFEDADISPEAKRLVKFFDDNKRSMKRIAAGLANYARLAMAEGSPDQVAMFDTGRDKATLLNEAINSAENPEAGESYAQEQTPPLIFKLTGDPVSKEYMAALEKLEDGGPITEEEYNAIPEIQDARKRVAEGSTLTMTGREAIRQKVYDKLMAYGSAVTKVVDGREKTVYNGEVRKDRRADIIIGLPASGKSSALVDPISIKYKSMLIDSDEAKQLIPEFDDGFGAGFVHEESKKIVARVQKKATDEGRNIVIPIVGSNYAKLKEGYIDALRKKGYKVYVHIADINPNVAAGRNLKRFATTGRFVDLVVTSFSYGNKPLEVFERVKKEGVADGYSRIDNSVFPGRWVEGTEDLSHDMGDLREGRGRVHRGTEAAGGNGGIELNAEETGGNSQEGTAPRFASEDTTETETPEEAYIRGKNLGEDYGIKEGIAYQKKKDAAKLRERLDAEIQKRKDRVKALRAAYKRKAALRREVDKMTRQIRRALRDDKIIWHAQQEIQALYEEAAPLSKSIKDVKIAALRELHEKVMTLQAEGRRELEMKRLMDTERVNKARDELMTPMLKRLYAARPRGALTGREDVGKQYEGLKGKGRQFLDWAAASLMGANRFFDWMDGAKGTFDGPWVRWFVDRGNEATDTKLKHLMERRLWIENRAAERGVNIKDLAKARDVGVPKGKLGNSTRWTVDELMSIYAGMKNEKSRAAILYGNFGAFGEEAGSMAARCVEALTEKERAFADDIIKEYELNFDRINDALIDVYNRGMAHEENYTPMKRLEYSTKDGLMSPDAAEALMNGQAAAGGMMRVEKGFMNSRAEIGNENQAAIDLGLFSIWNSQVDVQEHAAAFGGLIRDMRRILMGRTKAQPVSVQKAVKEVHGDAAWKNVKNYFNILARDNRQIADDVLNTSANWLARNMSKVYLCANLGTAAKQFSSFPRFLPYSGAGHLLSAIGQFTTRGRAFLEEVYALDPQLQNRQGNLLLNEMMEAEGGTYAKVINMGMAPIGWVDRAASAIGWKAVYDANIAKGLSQQDAIKAAQRAVTLTQPTTLRKDAPRVYQGSGLARLAMVFTNDCAQTFGITVYDLAAACRRGDAPGFLYTLAGVTLAAGMMRALTYGGPDEDDEESWAEWWRSALLRQSVEVVPILGKSAIHLWDTKGYSTGEMSPYLAPFAKMLSGANGLWDDKEDNNERAVWNLIEGGSLLAGFPSVALHRLRRVGQDVADGEAVKALQHMIGQRVRDKKARKALRM